MVKSVARIAAMFQIDPMIVAESDWKTFNFRIACYQIAAEDENKRAEAVSRPK